MEDMLENGRPLVHIDVGDIHCAELSPTDSALTSSFNNLAEHGDGLQSLFNIEEM